MTVLLLTSLLTSPASALSVPLGSCGENLKWSYDAINAALTVKGSGDMTDYPYSTIPWTLMRTKVKTVVIEEGVTSIGDNAFNSCSALETVTLPDSLTDIGNHAFYGCSALTAVDLPEGVTSIGNYAFNNCEALASVTLPDGLTAIGYGAFSGCVSLKSITLPDTLTDLGSTAFHRSGLESIVIPQRDLHTRSNRDLPVQSFGITKRTPLRVYSISLWNTPNDIDLLCKSMMLSLC